VITTVCCICVVLPIVIYLVVVAMFLSAVSSVASNIEPSDFTTEVMTSTFTDFNYNFTYTTTTSAPLTFVDAGPLNHAADICSGDNKYTATGAGTLE
jgi:hypothetical protein